jgi:hypothetical protein
VGDAIRTEKKIVRQRCPTVDLIVILKGRRGEGEKGRKGAIKLKGIPLLPLTPSPLLRSPF